MNTPAQASLPFCGRVSELETLKERWRLARDVENPCPQVVVIKAERGLGKTRLALEFYKWLRETEDGWLTKNYWPDAVEIVGRNLEVNPDPDRCKMFEVPIPYLWWGLRAADNGAENGIPGDAIATYDRFLAPHLATLHLKTEMTHHARSLAKELAKVGIDIGISTLHVDSIVSIGKGIFNTVDIVLEAVNQRALTDALERSLSRADSVLQDLQREFKPGTLTYAKVPAVVFLDDGQFIRKDPALPSFVERLMYRSVIERWPLLILVTHWRAELSSELAESESSFTGILKQAREVGKVLNLDPKGRNIKAVKDQLARLASSIRLGGVRDDLPGGYLSADNFTEIDLSPIPDLSDALRKRLPGLTQEQSTAILADVGGNPRVLEQIIAFLLEHEGLFEGYDTSRNLKSERLDETLKEIRHLDIFKIVLSRFWKFPNDVQEAICLASVQGMRFANDFVDQIAQDVLGRSVREALRRGEEPYSMLIGTNSDSGQTVGQFAERLFHQVAQERRQSIERVWGGEEALQKALESKVKKVIRESDPRRTDDPEAIGIVCGIALHLFEHAVKSEERWIAQRAASLMAYFDLQRGSLESAAALYERLLAINPTEPEPGYDRLEYFVTQHQQRLEILEVLAVIYRNLDWPARSAGAFRKIKWEAIHYLELPNEFVAALEKNKAVEAFEQWKRDNPRTPVSLYTWSVQKVVSAHLNLSELALAGYHQNAAEGDEKFTPSSFDIVAYEVDSDKPVEAPTVAAEILVAWAYAQDGVLGDGEAEKQHVWLLERLGRQALDRLQFETAERYLQRALKTAEELTDDMFRLSTLNNLIATFGQKGDVDRVTKYLELALPIVNSYINEPTFPVDLLIEDSGPDGRPVVVERRRIDLEPDQEWSHEEAKGSRWIRRAHVPVRFSKEFDEHPDEVLSRDRTMMGVIANVFGNAGHRALAKNEASKAKQNFLSALSIHEEIGDPRGSFHDLERLVHIAHIDGKREEACSHLRRCLALAPVLRQVDPRRWKNIDRETRDAMREAGCTDEGSIVAPIDRDPIPFPDDRPQGSE